MHAAPAGWYPDPADPQHLRWWDGSQWMVHVHAGAAATTPARKPRRWLLPVVIVASFLVIALIVSGGIAAVSLGGHAIGAVQALSLTSLQLGDSAAPSKMGRATDSPSAPTTAGAALNGERNDVAIPTSCATLLYLAPMRAADAGSKDRVQPLGTFAGTSPKGIDNPWVQATAREYSSTAAATAQLTATTAAVSRCHVGYSSSDFIADHITAVHQEVNGMKIVGWSERDTATTTGKSNEYDEYYVLDLQKGNVVVRATCDIPNGSTYTVSTCDQWWGTIAGKLAGLKGD